MNFIIKTKNYKNGSEECSSTKSLKTNKLCVNTDQIKYIPFKPLSLMLILILFRFIKVKRYS